MNHPQLYSSSNSVTATLEKPLEFLDRTVLETMDLTLFKELKVLPLRMEDPYLYLLTADGIDFPTFQQIEKATGSIVIPVTTSQETLDETLEDVFERNLMLNASASAISQEIAESFGGEALSIDELEASTDAEPVVRLSRLILDEAIALNASDIHIEPLDRHAVVRFRVDGMLKKHMDLEIWLFHPLTSRLKIMAGMDIAEKRVPQDGRIRYRGNGEQFDLRVSTLPTHLGEKTVIRLLKQDFSFLNLDFVGLPSKQHTELIDIINKPQGLFLVTGPTGSGKSSTLFAALNRIKDKEINITTIENPVEYKIPGVNQVQINEKAGITFAATLRSILRQDPDVILVGETRDRETAEIALQASQTGHLVFSTLHTNDAIAAITRLRDLGIPGYLIASSLVGVMAQRLVRRLCSCHTTVTPSEAVKTQWERVVGPFPFDTIPEPQGCEECGHSGFSGRIGLFELFSVTDLLRKKITEEVAEQEIRSALKSEGFQSMIDHGVSRVMTGETSVEEVLRVVTVTDR